MRHSFAPDDEQKAALGFHAQSANFDTLYQHDSMIAYKRERVRAHISRFLPTGSSVLELNAGTCEDAIWLAGQGHRVHATDIADGMLQQARKKIAAAGRQDVISLEKCSFTALDTLQQHTEYDMIFSNFAGLNCTGRLDRVLQSLPALVKPGGVVTLVMLPPFCLWETMLVFKGKFRTAFRRFSGRKGSAAKVEGKHFRCYYYPPSFIAKYMRAQFDVLSVEGLCTIAPPSYLQGFAEKRPRLYGWLCKMEEKLMYCAPWKSIGDYYIISLRRK